MWDNIFDLIYGIINNVIIKMESVTIWGISYLDISITILLLSIMIKIFVAKTKEKN